MLSAPYTSLVAQLSENSYSLNCTCKRNLRQKHPCTSILQSEVVTLAVYESQSCNGPSFLGALKGHILEGMLRKQRPA